MEIAKMDEKIIPMQVSSCPPCRRKRTRHVFHTLLFAAEKGRRIRRRGKAERGEQTQQLLLLSVVDLSSVYAAVAAPGVRVLRLLVAKNPLL
jgi:hypothetical protein